MTQHRSAETRDADVIVVGAGPAGAAAAYHLAHAGKDVLLLEKGTFPRDKVCGDGLTPRAVKQLIAMGIDIDQPGWQRNKGLRIVGGGHRIELPWPDLAQFPGYGMVRPRMQLDEILARHAAQAGARLQEMTTVTGPLVDERSSRVIGVTARDKTAADPRAEVTYRAPVVIGADGVAAKLAVSRGIQRRENRPMAVAVRAYYETPRHDDEWMESWLELWAGEPGKSDLLPGYGWIFACGDGTANVGLGLLNTSRGFQSVDYRDSLKRWLANTPVEWGFQDEANRRGKVGSAALPMGFNRKPHYDNGLLLVGDAAGMVNPFNGEGIDYGLEAGHLIAAHVVQALARPEGPQRERVLHGYAAALDETYGGYFTLGRLFAKLVGNPTFMRQATRYGLPRPTLMRFTLKLMANLTDPRGGDAMDRIINGLSKVVPDA